MWVAPRGRPLGSAGQHYGLAAKMEADGPMPVARSVADQTPSRRVITTVRSGGAGVTGRRMTMVTVPPSSVPPRRPQASVFTHASPCTRRLTPTCSALGRLARVAEGNTSTGRSSASSPPIAGTLFGSRWSPDSPAPPDSCLRGPAHRRRGLHRRTKPPSPDMSGRRRAIHLEQLGHPGREVPAVEHHALSTDLGARTRRRCSSISLAGIADNV